MIYHAPMLFTRNRFTRFASSIAGRVSRHSPAVHASGLLFFSKRKSAHGADLRFCISAALFLLLPLASFGADATGETQRHVVSLDVLGGGALASFVTWLMMWLSNRKEEAKRMPPLGEEAAKTYATKDELIRMEASLRKDIADTRASIVEYDSKAENRARGTHARIDSLYKSAEKNNRALGILIGIISEKRNIPAGLSDANGD